MAEKSILALLRETFPASSKEDWKRTAGQEIDGQDPLKILAWKNPDQVTFLPYYDREDVNALHDRKESPHLPSPSSDSAPGGWASLPPVVVTDEVTANAIALEHLNKGADGVLFDLSAHEAHSVKELLNAIEWPYCRLSFKLASAHTAIQLYDHLAKKKYDVSTLNGSLFWEKLPESNLPGLSIQKNIQGMGLWILPSTPVQEIVAALLQGVHAVDLLVKRNGLSVGEVIHQVAFSLAAEGGFLLTIAKFKALRLLWFQVAQAYGVKSYTHDMLHLHARSEAWKDDGFQPHGNLLNSTTTTLASVLGGCNAVSVFAEDMDNTMMSRIARNVSNILREESHVDKVADPIAGSYAIEAMTGELAREAWKNFQSAVQSF
jgi:methylmalonyl-CoA mutase